MKSLRILPRAALDLEESSLFFELESGDALAARFESAARKSFQWLCDNPGVGAPRQYLRSRLTGLRMWPIRGFEKHLIFYRLLGNTLEIVRVLHGARDLDRIFGDEE